VTGLIGSDLRGNLRNLADEDSRKVLFEVSSMRRHESGQLMHWYLFHHGRHFPEINSLLD
jgi:hypothetical protein